MHSRLRTGPGGFTLIELLVVIAIIALISAIALPTILTGLNERRVSEAARILQATLAGTRDAAIRANAPRGIRLLPDPVLNGQSDLTGFFAPLASNRFVPIEPGPDYSEGLVIAVPANSSVTYYATIYSTYNAAYVGQTAKYLILAESDFSSGVPNNPTNWILNVRQGDKLRFADSGAIYTIAGPISGPPYATGNPNSERTIACTPPPGATGAPLAGQTGWSPEFLFLMNGQDDNGNGWIDEECDGIDNDGDGIIDPGFNGVDDDGINGIDDPAELLIGKYSGSEFEQEVYVGSQVNSPPNNVPYTIYRRAVVSPGAKETTLPEGVVIDMTTWNIAAASIAGYQVLLPERSRLPVDPYTNYVDIMIDQAGRVVTSGAGTGGTGSSSANSPLSSSPFYHFWLTEREGVVPPFYQTQILKVNGSNFPTSIPNSTASYRNNGSVPVNVLPMPQGTVNYAPPSDATTPIVTPYLTGERRLVTLFVKTGQITSNSIQNFNGANTNAPFYDAQAGIKEPL